MKTSLLTLILFIFLSGQAFATGEKTHPSSLPSYLPPGGNFVVAEVLTQAWIMENWENQHLTSYNYVFDTLVSEKIIQDWIEGNWMNSSLSTFTYNLFGQPEMSSYYAWDVLLDQWQENLRGIYSYNPITHLLEELVYQVNDGVVWRNELRYLYTYTESGQLSITLWQNWNNSESNWVNRSLTTYTYDGEGLLQEMLVQDWTAGDWQNFQSVLYSYNGMGWLVTELTRNWMGMFWVDDIRNTMMYNPEGQMTSELQELWEGTEWKNHREWTFGYDANGNLVMKLQKDWSEIGGWVNSLLDTYEYYVVGIAEAKPDAGDEALIVYPNPASTDIHVILPGSDGILLVTDLLGREAFRMHVQPEMAQFTIRGLASGIYIASFQGEGRLLKARFIVRR